MGLGSKIMMDIEKYIVLAQVDMCLTTHSYIAFLGYILQQFNNDQQPSKPRLGWNGLAWRSRGITVTPLRRRAFQ